MFKGKAELVDPEKNTPVATFTETCQNDGTAKMKVVLKAPITISGTERLAIYSTVKDQEVIAVTANGGASTAIHEFEGSSSLGCLADGSDITLTRSPGGPLGTLLVVLGKGTIHEEVPIEEPNSYDLSGHHLHVTYSTSGIDGKPHFSYQDLHQTLDFSGDQIRRVETEIGALVSVRIRLTVDSGGTSFSLLVPRVNIPGEQTVPIRTEGVTTLHKFPLLPAAGQRDFYTVTPLTGTAMRVHF
jgi:hypothetical protein